MATPSPTGRVPSKLTTVAIDQPFTNPADGTLMPWAGQFLARMVALLGQPSTTSTASAGGTQTVSAQLSTLSDANDMDQALVGADAATMAALQALQRAIMLPPLRAVTASPFIAAFFTPGGGTGGLYLASQELAYFRVGVAMQFPAGLGSSFVDCETAPAANVSGSIYKNATIFGTYAIAAGSLSGTFTASTATAFLASDFLKVLAPTTADTAMLGLRFTLAGTRFL